MNASAVRSAPFVAAKGVPAVELVSPPTAFAKLGTTSADCPQPTGDRQCPPLLRRRANSTRSSGRASASASIGNVSLRRNGRSNESRSPTANRSAGASGKTQRRNANASRRGDTVGRTCRSEPRGRRRRQAGESESRAASQISRATSPSTPCTFTPRKPLLTIARSGLSGC